MDFHSSELVEAAFAETGLARSPRLGDVELPRTSNQLRAAAAACRSGSWALPTIDTQAGIRSTYAPLGAPVAVFGPNNFPLAFNGVAGGDLTGRGVVPYEQWSHVALTLSPTEFAYWLNGIHDVSRQLESAPTYQIGDGLIGGYLSGELIEREWAGLIDDVRIYNRALSPGEVLWLAGKTDPAAAPL